MVVGEPTVGTVVAIESIVSVIAMVRVWVIKGGSSQRNWCRYGGDIGFDGDGLGSDGLCGWNVWYLWSDWQVIAGGVVAVFIGHVVDGERLSLGVGEAQVEHSLSQPTMALRVAFCLYL